MRSLLILLFLYVCLAIKWNLATPLFEGPDAYYHFAVIQHIAETGELPPKDNPNDHPWQQITFHAPLYHQVSALLIRTLNTSNFLIDYPVNPHAQIGEPSASNNQNFVVHTGDAWQDTGLAVRIVRFFSSVLGGITLVGVYGLARLLVPQRPRFAVLAVALVLLNPQFLHIHTIVSNDTLVTTLTTLSLVAFVSLFRREISIVPIAVLAILLGFNALAKASGLVLYPVVMLSLLFGRFPTPASVYRRLLYLLIIALSGVLIAGWWYVDNFSQFGDFSATVLLAQATSARVGGIPDLIGELRGMFFSFWGLFGWFNITAPTWFYVSVTLLTVLGVLGFVWRVIRGKLYRQVRWETAGLLLFGVLFIGAWWNFHQLVNAGQGRLLFPMLGVIALCLAYGLLIFPRWLILLIVSGLAFASVTFPLTLIAPTYAIESPIEAVDFQPPRDAFHGTLREPWEDTACLNVWAHPQAWDGQSSIDIETWWQATCSVSGYWSVFVHFIDLEQETCVVGDTHYILSQTDTMLQGGHLPIPALEVGKVYMDTLTVSPPNNLDLLQDWYVQMGLYDAGGTFIRAFVAEDESSNLGQIGQCAPETIQFRLSPTHQKTLG